MELIFADSLAMLFVIIGAIFAITNLLAWLLYKLILPWQAVRTMRKYGIIPKQKKLLSIIAQLDELILNVSGTVTRGIPIISDIIPVGIAPLKLLAIAASAEKGVHHPLAEAIVDRAKEKELPLEESAAINFVPGKGVEALINHQAIRLGTAKFLEEHDIKVEAELFTKADQLASKGKIVVFISIGNFCRGFITFIDPVRETAPGAVIALKEREITPIILTSMVGSTARNKARQAEITQVKAEMDVMKKVREILVMKTKGTIVGVTVANKQSDSLVQMSDISFALGNATESARKMAQVIIAEKDFGLIATAKDIAQYTRSKQRNSFIIAVAFNLLLAGAAVFLLQLERLPYFAPILPILIGLLFLVGLLWNQLTFDY